jgi:hypothetical protein
MRRGWFPAGSDEISFYIEEISENEDDRNRRQQEPPSRRSGNRHHVLQDARRKIRLLMEPHQAYPCKRDPRRGSPGDATGRRCSDDRRRRSGNFTHDKAENGNAHPKRPINSKDAAARPEARLGARTDGGYGRAEDGRELEGYASDIGKGGRRRLERPGRPPAHRDPGVPIRHRQEHEEKNNDPPDEPHPRCNQEERSGPGAGSGRSRSPSG